MVSKKILKVCSLSESKHKALKTEFKSLINVANEPDIVSLMIFG